MSVEYWYMFPISILIATTAMASGIEGGTFFAPLFLLALGLPPDVAIGTALVTEVFGFASGLFAFARKKLIDYKLGMTMMLVTVPLALLGSWISGWADPNLLKTILSLGLLALAYVMLKPPKKGEIAALDRKIEAEIKETSWESCLTTAEGERICYTVCNKHEGMIITGIGGLFMGMISNGLGHMNGFFFLKRCKLPSKVAVATSVLIVAVTVLSASAGHFVRFAREGGEALSTVLSLVIFTVPGVIIGGQIGPLVASKISQQLLEKALGAIFVLIATLILGEMLL